MKEQQVGSMEDSFTNIFKLAELNGLTWKKWSHTNPVPSLPSDDQVLSAYARCMKEGVLCTWRRQLDGAESGEKEFKKELWCFWWGERPAVLEWLDKEFDGQAGEECRWGENDRGEDKTGLDYQARSLLFKALHNAVERKLCQEGWTRLCRWFILLPPGSAAAAQPSAAISLNFFLNGITICCAIEPGVPPSLARLRPTATAPELLPMEVITAPWGLRGYFSGQYYRNVDFCVRKMNEEWRDFYPYALPEQSDEKDDEPFAVELAIGDGNCAFKVIYPARLVFTSINQAENQGGDKLLPETEDTGRIREELSRHRVEHSVSTLAQHASRDVLPDMNHTTPFPNATSPFQPIEKLRPTPRTTLSSNSDKSKNVRRFRVSTFHKKQPQERFVDFGCVEPTETASPVEPSQSAASSAPTSVKAEVKDEETKPEEPPSPKWVEEKVEPWAGLKLPLDATGATLKSERCRPQLQLDGLEPEVIYRKRHELPSSVDSLVFAEFKPRKRLKRAHITEEQDALGIRRLVPDAEPQQCELEQAVKEEEFAFKEDQDITEKRITLKQERKAPYMDDYGVLTPSPEQKDEDYPNRYRPVTVTTKVQPLVKEPMDSMSATLTPPTPKADYERINPPKEDELPLRMTRRKSTYELAEEKAQNGIYAPMRHPADEELQAKLQERAGPYQPSWKPGSLANKKREARKAKARQREAQKVQLAETKMSQPHTPGSGRGPRTPGMAQPGTPGTVGPPSTPGNYSSAAPRTPGGPPSVGPQTPFGGTTPHTPGSMRNPHTPGTSRSPGVAVAPSPAASGRDFSAPKTPRTPRTPGSVRTPGSKANFGGRICGVSSLQEVSALLLSLVLGDSVLDAHRDRNFIQAPLCVCRGDTIGIDGPLIGIKNKQDDDNDEECTCGFSAISSRSSAVGRWGGILLEDEVNLVGAEIESDAFHIRGRPFLDDCLRTTPEIRAKNGMPGFGKPDLRTAGQLLAHLVAKYGVDGMVDGEEYWNDEVYELWNFALFHDAVSACTEALKTARCVLEPQSSISIHREVSENVITEFSLPQQNNNTSKTANHETIRLLSHLQPMLQEAIQKDGQDRCQDVKGPLTWSEFVRVGDKSCNITKADIAPLPVPQLQVGATTNLGSSGSTLQIAPHSLQFWDKIGLEPAGQRRDVYYLALLPDSTFVKSRIKRWFPELSTAYARLSYGSHKPLPQLRDARTIERDTELIWIKSDQKGTFQERYKRTLETVVGPLLSRTEIRRRHGFVDQERPGPGYDRSKKDRVTPHLTQNEPQLVVYVFEPAQLRESEHPRNLFDLEDLSSIKEKLPAKWRDRLVVKFMPTSVLANPFSASAAEKIAADIFKTCLNPMDADSKQAKSFTGFGPTSERKLIPTQNFTVQHREPFLCLPGHSAKGVDDLTHTLYCAYCPSQDHRWLMVSCTDDSGGQVKTQILSIDVPNKYFSVRRKVPHRLIGDGGIGDKKDKNKELGLVRKIWEYCEEVSSLIFPTGGVRLVVTRVGRIGAGETKEWCAHFGRNVKRKSKEQQKTKNVDIISASLTSLEPDVTIRVIPEQTRSGMNSEPKSREDKASREERANAVNIQPADAAMSHLAVFAISSTIRKQTTQQVNTNTPIDDDLDPFPENDIPYEDDEDENIINEGFDNDGFDDHELHELSQQPLAVALWISNSVIPVGMPAWFGPLNRNQPTAIRVALHINLSSKTETTNGAESHPLDTSQPATGLRFIVENLERLSWLTTAASGRHFNRSALPVHVTALGRLHRHLTVLTNRVQQFHSASTTTQAQQQATQQQQPTPQAAA